MSRTTQDSGLNILPGWGSSNGDSLADDIPVLDLSSSGPLPLAAIAADNGASLAPAGTTRSGPSAPAGRVSGRAQSEIWLDGDTLMCACPDCHAPMSIRLWLMVADCWYCGTSIELTEEQEREIQRLLQQREQKTQRPAAQVSTPVRPKQAPPTPAAVPTPPPPPPKPQTVARPTETKQRPRAEPVPQRPPTTDPTKRTNTGQRVAAAAKPIGVRAKISKMAALGSVQVFLHEFFKDMPAWLVSFIFHLALLTLLGMLTLEEDSNQPYITLSAAVSRNVDKGGEVEIAHPTDDARFDLPVPDKNKPKNKQQERALLEADQAARALRLDPNTPDPQLPDLARVKSMLASSDVHRSALAARDPRLRVEMIKAEGGTTLTEAAVARGLNWMMQHQSPDGSWSLHDFHRASGCNCNGRGQIKSNSAATSLCLLPYLGAGQTHLTGQYKDNVAHALRWLIEHQKPDGDLRADSQGNSGMYAHGQSAIVLSEAYGLTQDEMLREPAQQALDFIVAAQHQGGGWRYRPREAGDTSVLGWQLMALQSGRAAGLNVPDSTLELAGHYLDSVQSDGGAQYGYQRGRGPTPAMTAEALLCRMYLGWKKDQPGLVKGVELLVNNHLPSDKQPDIYYWYYGTQVLHHYGGKEWEKWNRRMRDILVESQEKQGHQAGSWAPRGQHTQGGRIYMTSLAVCTLEVYYRHAPIFRKIKLD